MTNKTLTGLEAIELMKEGKMVVDDFPREAHIYKIESGNVQFKVVSGSDEKWKVDKAFDFSATYMEYIEPKKLTGWERLEEGETYYKIATSTTITSDIEEGHSIDNVCYNNINYFSTEEKAEEINFKQTLFRKLQRFSDENGGTEIDWNNKDERKWFIAFDFTYHELERDFYGFFVHYATRHKEFGQVYFISEDVAEKAIELFKDDLIKYFMM